MTVEDIARMQCNPPGSQSADIYLDAWNRKLFCGRCGTTAMHARPGRICSACLCVWSGYSIRDIMDMEICYTNDLLIAGRAALEYRETAEQNMRKEIDSDHWTSGEG